MKAYWKKIEARIDTLSLRERTMAFLIAALAVVTLVTVTVVDPLSAREEQLSQKIRLDQQQIAALQAEIQLLVSTNGADPDAAERLRLQQLKRESNEIRAQLAGMQQGLVAPEKMATLLEDLLRRDGRLQLRSLKTLPVALLNEAPAVPVPQGAAAAAGQPGQQTSPPPQPRDAVYKHAVEIVVQGSYPDLLRYLSEIEAMPWHLFWAKAELKVDSYPSATLSLTLFTLSLDRKWLNI